MSMKANSNLQAAESSEGKAEEKVTNAAIFFKVKIFYLTNITVPI